VSRHLLGGLSGETARGSGSRPWDKRWPGQVGRSPNGSRAALQVRAVDIPRLLLERQIKAGCASAVRFFWSSGLPGRLDLPVKICGLRVLDCYDPDRYLRLRGGPTPKA
jgi:hypothetical protein